MKKKKYSLTLIKLNESFAWLGIHSNDVFSVTQTLVTMAEARRLSIALKIKIDK